MNPYSKERDQFVTWDEEGISVSVWNPNVVLSPQQQALEAGVLGEMG